MCEQRRRDNGAYKGAHKQANKGGNGATKGGALNATAGSERAEPAVRERVALMAGSERAKICSHSLVCGRARSSPSWRLIRSFDRALTNATCEPNSASGSVRRSAETTVSSSPLPTVDISPLRMTLRNPVSFRACFVSVHPECDLLLRDILFTPRCRHAFL